MALSAAYDQLVAGGVKDLHYVRSKDLYARDALYGDGADVTMGGVHPGDVGTRGPGPPGPVGDLSVSYLNRFCMALLYGRAGRLTAKNGGFRRGQCSAARSSCCTHSSRSS